MYRARNLKNRKNCITLFEGKEGLEFIVFDTETSGKDAASSYIVELAAIKCRVENHIPCEIERMDLYIKPPMPLTQTVIDIHHITNEFLEDKPNEEEVFDTIYKFFGEKPVVVGHNVWFDIGMLSAMYIRNEKTFSATAVLDTLEMARDLVFGKELENYKLGTLTELFGLDMGLTFHNALDDVTATLRLLNVFYDEYSKLPPITPKQRLYINRISYWKGYNKKQAGIYLETNVGKMYFSTLQKAWFSSEIDLDIVDIGYIEKCVLEKMEIETLEEFGKLTEKKFADIKQRLKEKRVYL